MALRLAPAQIGRLLAMALRAAVWRKTVTPPVLGLGAFVGWCLLAFAVQIGLNFLAAGEQPQFDIYGLSALVAWRTVLVLVSVFFVPSPYRATVLSAAIVLSLIANVASAAMPVALSLLPAAELQKVWGFEVRHAHTVLDVVYLIWVFGAVFALFRSTVAGSRWNKLARTAGYVAATFAVTQVFPHLPVFAPFNFDPATANMWEARRAAAIAQAQAERPRVDSGQVALAQPALLDAAVSRLLPQRSGVADIYTIAIAGSASEDVFIREVNGALASLGRVLPIEGRVLRLINHPSTINAAPIATLQNFAAAVRAIGNLMNKNEDILLLFMTSHGTQEGFALAMDGVTRAMLRPEQVAAVLAAEGIKSRIVIVSACYSGIFIGPLANDSSVVLTAADENNPSFGCSNERDWTFFGDALFNQSLKPGRTFEQAFDEAKRLIAAWETNEKLSPSNPQGSFGAALSARLQSLYVKTDVPAAWPWPQMPQAGKNDSIWGRVP